MNNIETDRFAFTNLVQRHTLGERLRSAGSEDEQAAIARQYRLTPVQVRRLKLFARRYSLEEAARLNDAGVRWAAVQAVGPRLPRKEQLAFLLAHAGKTVDDHVKILDEAGAKRGRRPSRGNESVIAVLDDLPPPPAANRGEADTPTVGPPAAAAKPAAAPAPQKTTPTGSRSGSSALSDLLVEALTDAERSGAFDEAVEAAVAVTAWLAVRLINRLGRPAAEERRRP